jgi:alcohol dehydrogenase class IV
LIAPGDPVNTLERLMDSLTHAIEAYTTRSYDMKPSYKSPTERPTYGGSEYAGGNEVTDLFLAQAIVLMGKYLRRIVYQPNDLEAR